MIEHDDSMVILRLTGSPTVVARQLYEVFAELERDSIGMPVYRLAWDTGADGEYETEATLTLPRRIVAGPHVFMVNPMTRRCLWCGGFRGDEPHVEHEGGRS